MQHVLRRADLVRYRIHEGVLVRHNSGREALCMVDILIFLHNSLSPIEATAVIDLRLGDLFDEVTSN